MATDAELDTAIAEQREMIAWTRRVTEEGRAVQLRDVIAQERIADALEKLLAVVEERNS